MAQLTFEAKYYADKLRIVNPAGDVGLITLWSSMPTVVKKLQAEAPAVLDAGSSRVAVMANLYGDGMLQMFCNLLLNPQVRHLVAFGQRLDQPTCDEIEAFLQRGLEDAVLLGRPVKRIPGTDRVFQEVPGFDEDRLRARTFHYLGGLSSTGLADRLQERLRSLPRCDDPGERLEVEIPAVDASAFRFAPSEPAGHEVIRRRPLECWRELVVRAMRFGRPTAVGDGIRLELLNAKVVITEPVEEPADRLAKAGFSAEAFSEYQRKILDPVVPENVAYTYGNRLRSYFRDPDGNPDALATAIRALCATPGTRRAYISLWDTATDLPSGSLDNAATPCLTTLFFRHDGERLHLTATYRSHNLLTAWLQNVYGLIAIQRHIAEGVGMELGTITVVSHALGINPESPRFPLAQGIAEAWDNDDDRDPETDKYVLREDPNGHFEVSLDRDRGLIVAEHRFGGLVLKRYEGRRAVEIERQVAADMAVSVVSHAMWLGRELTRHEQLLRKGT
jgi:hypothetical protein